MKIKFKDENRARCSAGKKTVASLADRSNGLNIYIHVLSLKTKSVI